VVSEGQFLLCPITILKAVNLLKKLTGVIEKLYLF